MTERQINEKLKRIELSPLTGLPLVSVLVSSYNYGRYLEEAILSVCTQAYSKLEILVCDDGSTDDSWQIILRLGRQDPRIIPLRQPNSGQAAALNRAYEASSGDVVCLLDADDLFYPKKVESVVAALSSSEKCGMAIHRMDRVDAARRTLGVIPLLYELPRGWQPDHYNLLAPQMLPGLPPCSGLSLRRILADRLFPLPVGLRAYADTLIQVVAPMLTSIAAIDDVLSAYRIHGENTAGRKRYSPRDVEKLINYEHEIWSAWRFHIQSILGSVALAELPPLTRPPSVLDYANARFHDAPHYKGIYRKVISLPAFRSLPLPHRWAWGISILLPNALFRRFVSFVYGQGVEKDLIGRLLRIHRTVRRWFFRMVPLRITRYRAASPDPSDR